MTTVNIRKANSSDASDIFEAQKIITSIPGQFVSRPSELDLNNFERKITQMNASENNIYVVAEKNGQILGHALLESMGLEALKHIARLTIAIHPGFENQSIGLQLMNYLISWAQSNPEIEKLELNVRAVNQRAIHLYQKVGFEIEGCLRKRIKLADKTYIDDYIMGLFV